MKGRRRLLRWTLVVLAVVLLARLTLPLWLSPVLTMLAGAAGFDLHCESLRVSLHDGRIQMTRVHLAARDQEQSGLTDLRWEHAEIDLALRQLWRGRLHADTVTVRGADVTLRLPPAATAGPPASAPASPPVGPAPAAATALDFSLPCAVSSLSLADLALTLQPAAGGTEPAVQVTGHLNGYDLGHATRPNRLSLLVHSPTALDTLRIEANWTGALRQLRGSMALHVVGLRPRAAAGLCRALGITPLADTVGCALAADVDLGPSPGHATASTGDLRISRLHAAADREPCLDLEEATTRLASWDTAHLALGDTTIRGLFAHAGRDGEHGLVACGLGFAHQDAPANPPLTPAASPATAFAFSLGDLVCTGGRLVFADAAGPLKSRWELGIARLAHQRGSWEAELSAPGISERIELEARRAEVSDSQRWVVDLRASGITLQALAPMLQSAGWAPELRAGRLALHAEVGWKPAADAIALTATLGPVELADGASLLHLDRASLDHAEFGAAGPRLGTFEIAGLRLAARIARDASWHALGLRSVAAPGPVPAPAAAPPGPPSPLQLALTRLLVRDALLVLRDESGSEPAELQVPLTAELSNLDLLRAGTASAASRDGARFALRVGGTNWAETLACEGSVDAGGWPAKLGGNAILRGQGLDLRPWRSWLTRAGLEPNFEQGRLQATAEFELANHATGMRLSFGLRDLELATPTQPVARLRAVHLREFDPSLVHAADLTVEGPEVWIRRDADGHLHLPGLILRAAPPIAAEAAASRPSSTVSAGPDAASPACLHVRLSGGLLHWRDELADPALEESVRADRECHNVDFGPSEIPARYDLTLALANAGTRITSNGSCQIRWPQLQAEATFAGTGFRAATLVTYLPPDLQPVFRDGHFGGRVSARVAGVPAGGQSVELVVRDLRLTEGDLAVPWLAFDQLLVAVPRLDLAAGAVAIREIALTGLELAARRTPEGRFTLLGFTTDATPAGGTAPPPPLWRAGPRRLRLPRVDLDRLRVECKRLWLDEGTAARPATPIEARFTLETARPLRVLDENPGELPPIEVTLQGGAPPLLGAFALRLAATPFASSPGLDLGLEAKDIGLAQLTACLPQLADAIAATKVASAGFAAKVHAELQFQRLGPFDFDLGRGFGFTAEVGDLALRDTATQQVLLGFDTLACVAPRIVPPQRSVHVRELEIHGLQGQVAKQVDGFQAGGLVWRTTATTPASAPSSAPAATTPPPRWRLDDLVIHAANFELRNDTLSPPTVLPIRFFEAEGHRLGNATAAGVTTRFQGSMTAPPLCEEFAFRGAVVNGPAPEGLIVFNLNELALNELRGLAAQSGVVLGGGIMNGGARVRFEGTRGTRIDLATTFRNLALEEPSDGPIRRVLKLPASLDTVLFLLRDQEGELPIKFGFTVGTTGIATAEVTQAAILALSEQIALAIAKSPLRLTSGLTGLLGITGNARVLPEPVATGFALGDAYLDASARAYIDTVAARLRAEGDLVVTLRHEFAAADVAHARQLAVPGPQDLEELFRHVRQRVAESSRLRDQAADRARSQLLAGTDADAAEAMDELRRRDRELATAERALDEVAELMQPARSSAVDARTRRLALALARLRQDQVRAALRAAGIQAERIVLSSPRLDPGTEPASRVWLQVRVRQVQ